MQETNRYLELYKQERFGFNYFLVITFFGISSVQFLTHSREAPKIKDKCQQKLPNLTTWSITNFGGIQRDIFRY